jgi:hypothetical protein
VEVAGAFAPGARVRGKIVNPKYAHLTMEIVIEKMEPQRLFSWRWHPAAIDEGVDYSAEPMTLVAFELEEVAGGTQLTVVESGFDRVPPARRARAFDLNEHGWEEQMKRIERHVSAA